MEEEKRKRKECLVSLFSLPCTPQRQVKGREKEVGPVYTSPIPSFLFLCHHLYPGSHYLPNSDGRRSEGQEPESDDREKRGRWMVNGRSSIETKDLFSPSHSLRSSLFPHPSTNYFRMWNKNERDEREGFPVDQPSSPIPSSLHSIPFTCPFSFLLFFFHLRVSERNEKTQEGKGEGREEKRGREAT